MTATGKKCAAWGYHRANSDTSVTLGDMQSPR
jgi:hypothetical protein